MRKPSNFLLAGILALVLSFALFGNGIGGDFVFDDFIVIVGNPFLGGLSKFAEIFITPYFAYQPAPGLYRPLTIASYSLNAFIFGTSPASFHVINILFHAFTSFLVFILLHKLSGKTGAWAGFLFFMFLPIHTEAVTSIVGRAEVLSLFFVLSALIFSLRRSYILASGSFFLGLLSKEMAVSFLPIWIFLEFFFHKEKIKVVSKKLIYFILSFLLYAVFRYIALGQYFLKNDATPVYNSIKFAPFFTGIWTSFKVFFLYIEKTFIPSSLSTDYSFNQIPFVANPFRSFEALFGIIILVFLIFLFFKTKDFLVKFGIFAFLASYFVVSNWIFKTGTIMAERLMYAPSLGLAFLTAALIQNLRLKTQNNDSKLKILILSPKFLLFSFSFLALLVWYGWVVIDRNRDWLNNKSLYESAYAAAPGSIVNQTNMAYLDFINGKHAEAEFRLNKILALTPDHIPALNLSGQNYKKLGQYQKAEELWQKAIKLRKDFLRAYLSLGVLYYENGYFLSAEKVLTDAVNIYPRWSEILFLALTKTSLNKPDEAILLVNRFSEKESLRKELIFALGWAYLSKGDKENAYKYFEQVKDPKVSMEDFIKTFEWSKVVNLGEF